MYTYNIIALFIKHPEKKTVSECVNSSQQRKEELLISKKKRENKQTVN